jgi:hypothetical protein
VEDLRCKILADLKAGKSVSPKRIKRLIREDKIVIKGFEGFSLNSEETSRAVTRNIAGLRSEIEALESVLAASDKIIDALTEAAFKAESPEEAGRLRDMATEWSCHAAGVSSYWTRRIKPGAVDLPRAAGSEG